MYFRLLVTIFSLLLYASLAAAAPFAYIANSGADSVTAIDAGATPPVATATITLPPASYPYSVSVSPNGVHAYVACQDSLAVQVIDTVTNTVVKSLSLTYKPGGLAVNAAETRLYVADNNSNTLTVIDISKLFDTGSASEVARVTLDSSTAHSVPEGVALNAAGNRLYVANAGTGKIAIVSVNDVTDTYTKAGDIVLDPNDYPMGLAFSPTGNKLYVASNSGSVAVIDTATNAITVKLGVSTGITSVAVNPNTANKFAYAPDGINNKVRFIDTGATPTDALLATPAPSTGNLPWGIAVTPDGARLLITNNLDNNVTVLDAVTGNAIAGGTIAVGSKPTSMGNFMSPAYPYLVNASIDIASTGTGSIAPAAGAIPVTAFGRTFCFTPNGTDLIETVTLNGVDKGAPGCIDINNITANQDLVVKFAAPGSLNRKPLTVELLNIGGRVFTTPAGIDITSGIATAEFTTDSQVTITADFTANPTRSIAAWGGACSSVSKYVNSCTVTMDAAKSVTISFEEKPSTDKVMIAETGAYFANIAAALQAATEGQTIRVVKDYATIYQIDNVLANSGSAKATLSGGWETGCQTRNPDTYTRLGSLTVQSSPTFQTNAVIADMIVIQ